MLPVFEDHHEVFTFVEMTALLGIVSICSRVSVRDADGCSHLRFEQEVRILQFDADFHGFGFVGSIIV